MCGRYTLFDVDELGDRFAVEGFDEHLRSNYNVAPAQIMPVVTQAKDVRRIELMKWGLIPSWAKDPNIGYKLINARSETAFEKPMWRSIIKRQRCLVPATGFYEWKRVKKEKQPFFIRPRSEKLFAFAGVWDTWQDVEGRKWNTYSIMTTEPNKEMSSVHNRMPVILHQEDEASWLEPSHTDRSDLEPLLHPWEDNGLEMFEVSRDVNVAGNNDEKLIYPINSQ